MLRLIRFLTELIVSLFGRKKLTGELTPLPVPSEPADDLPDESEGDSDDVEPLPIIDHGPRGPLLVVDLYWKDVDGRPRWSNLVKDERYVGAIIKATEGISYKPATTWFPKNWKLLKSAAGSRYGDDWFRGAYHYLLFGRDGADQADFYLKTVERAGGWDDGCILPVVDVEMGSEGGPNYDATRSQIMRTTEAWVKRVKKATGRDVILYGRGAMRDKGITSRMGCKYLWDPQYGPKLSVKAIEKVGWTLRDTPLWQYTDGKIGATRTLAGAELPHDIPSFGPVDASVFLSGDLGDFKRIMLGR